MLLWRSVDKRRQALGVGIPCAYRRFHGQQKASAYAAAAAHPETSGCIIYMQITA